MAIVPFNATPQTRRPQQTARPAAAAPASRYDAIAKIGEKLGTLDADQLHIVLVVVVAIQRGVR